MAKESAPGMSRREIQQVIDEELRNLVKAGVARWKVRQLRGISTGLAALAHREATQAAGSQEVTEQALAGGVRSFVEDVNRQQAVAYRRGVEQKMATFRRTMVRSRWRRTCCSKLPINTWPFCDRSC